MGTPPEDDSGAGEGAPSNSTDPIGENQTRVEPRRGRLVSEPGIDVDFDDAERRQSDESIDVRLSGSIDVSIDESRPAP